MRTNRHPGLGPRDASEVLDRAHPLAALYMGPLMARLDELAARVEELERQRPPLAAVRRGRSGQSSASATRCFAQPPNVCRLEGEYWQMSYAGMTSRLRDGKGLRYIARLLAQPGRDVHVADLATDGVGGAAGEGAYDRTTGRHLGAVLDPRAMAEYRVRLAELRDELDGSTTAGDGGRAERTRQEMDAITEALSAAYGIGGRARRAGDPADRIRKAVTIQIRRTRERIRAVHAPLGRHLENALRTGFVCSYRPEHPVEWRL
jgi:hypothetical protein